MPLRLEEQTVRVETLIGENTAQTVVEGTVTLPPDRPQIGRILKTRATPRVESVRVESDRVVFDGALDLKLLYVYFAEEQAKGAGFDDDEEAHEDEQVVEQLSRVSWDRALPFSYTLDIPGATPEMLVNHEVVVESVNVDVRGDQQTVDADATVTLKARVTQVRQVTVATRVHSTADIDGEVQNVRIQGTVGKGSGAATVAERLSFGHGAQPERLVDVGATATLTKAEVREGEVVVTGSVDCEALYVGDAGVQQAIWSEAGQFTATVPVPGALPGHRARVQVQVQNVSGRLTDADAEGRLLEVHVTLGVTGAVIEAKELNVLTDLGARDAQIAVRKERLGLRVHVGERSEPVNVQGSLELADGDPPVERLLAGEALVALGDVHVLGDKVAIEGSITLTVLYAGRGEAGEVLTAATWPNALPVELELPLEGAAPGMERDVSLRVTEVSLDLLNRETIEAQVRLMAQARVARQVELEVVAEAVEVPPPPADPATFTFVIVQEGDTLWKLAQYYHTELDRILAANKWLEPDSELPAGRKVCIPRPGRLAS